MVVHTILSICNKHGEEIRRFKTTALTGIAEMKSVMDFISRKYENISRPFDIRIMDQSDGLVTLDQDYLQEYNPFRSEESKSNTPQLAYSAETTVEIQVWLPGKLRGQ